MALIFELERVDGLRARSVQLWKRSVEPAGDHRFRNNTKNANPPTQIYTVAYIIYTGMQVYFSTMYFRCGFICFMIGAINF